MTLAPGFYRFFIEHRILETHASEFRHFLFAAGLLPVRVEADYCQHGQNYVVQYGDDPPKDTLIRDAGLVWHGPECKFSLLDRKPPRGITAAEIRVIDVARRVAYQSGANLATVQRNLTDLADAIDELPPLL